ncbi:MAG: putative quinol monooxygenase [Granulosicoccaceae bacterium]
MIHVIAHITAKPGQRQAILDRFHANIPAVHAEEGCIEYQPVIDASGFDGLATALGEDSFVVVEKWSSEATLKAHAASNHMAEYAASVKDLIADRSIYVLENSG